MTLVFFVLSMGSGSTPLRIAILVGVLLFHELGHYAGMRAFGYRDVRMFFVPFFGAAVSGRRGSVAAWKDAVVLALGPIPGLVLGTAVLMGVVKWPLPLLLQIGEMLVLVNGFNLLPFTALDGGRLLMHAVFCRHRYLELAFTALGSALLGMTAFALSSIALGVFAFLSLLALPRRARILKAAMDVKGRLPVSADLATLDEAPARLLFDKARQALPEPLRLDVIAVGETMEDVFVASMRPPGVVASVVIVLSWVGTLLVVLVGVSVLALAQKPADWQPRSLGMLQVEMPDDPVEQQEVWETPAGLLTARVDRTTLGLVERFTAIQIAANHPIAPTDVSAWLGAARARLPGTFGVAVVPGPEQEITVDGNRGMEMEWHGDWRTCQVRVVVAGNGMIVLVASAPEPRENGRRFLESLRLLTGRDGNAGP